MPSSVFAFFCASSRAPAWTHEHWSRMLTISRRYGLKPTRAHVSRNTGSCVRGVHAAMTSRFTRCSLIISTISSCPVDEQTNMLLFAAATSAMEEA